jgi:hypothetical protein
MAIPKEITQSTETEKEIKKLKGDTQKDAQLVYPRDLFSTDGGHGHFILFNINTIQGTRFKSAKRRTENDVESPFSSPIVNQSAAGSISRYAGTRNVRSTESIALHMPSSITTNYGVQWGATGLGLAGRMIQAYGNFENITLGDVKNTISEEFKRMLGGAVQALTPINAADAIEFYTGTLSNPFVEVLFKGVGNRDFSVSFKFTPRSSDEMQVARSIVRRFKFHQHPEYKYRAEGSAYFLRPSTFDITFMYIDNDGAAKRNAWLHRLSTCALTNVSVDNTPDGEYNVNRDDNSLPAIKLCPVAALTCAA